MVLANSAVVAALIYRWYTGTPLVVLALVGVIVLALVNGLLWLSQRSFNRTRGTR
jgi:hypothetical protein